jgi:peptide/nickel transport system substrate-binding protein
MKIRLVAVAGAVSLFAAACVDNGVDNGMETVEDAEAGEPVSGGSITVGLEAETNSWLPGDANLAEAGVNVALAIYDPLLRRDEDGVPRPYLAESLEPNADLSEWTLELRPGVTFHDGTPLDAQAIKTVFDDYIQAEGSNLAGEVDDVVSVGVIDELTVVYTLEGPNAAFADVLTGGVGLPFSPTAAAAAGPDAGSQPVGTGPFVFESWQRDNRLVVTRNDDYWQAGFPYLDEIVFRPIPDEDTRLASLAAGDIDVLQSLRQSTVARARDLGGVDSYEFIGNNSGAAIFNTEQPPLDDVRIRRALAYALDQDEMIAVLGGTGMTEPATQYLSAESPYHSEKAADVWPTNRPDEAEALLEEYKADPDRSDGRSVGSTVSIQFDCPPDPSLIELAQLYQAQWNAVGFEVDLNQVEQATHISDALAGDYEAKCWRVSSQNDPYRVFSEAFEEGAPLNFTRFSDPEIDAELEVLRTTADMDTRKQAVEEISLVLAEAVPNTFTGHTVTVLAAQQSVRGIDGWTFPDGTTGEGVPSATTMWGHVWLSE